MLLREYAWFEHQRPWHAVRLETALFGPQYLAYGSNGAAIDFRDPEPLLDIIASEFTRGLKVEVYRHQFGAERALRVTEGWRPCDIPVLRDWIMIYNLTQSWDHINVDALGATPS